MSKDKFVEYNGKRFPLDDGMTLDQAKDVMALHFPELAEPGIETKKEGDVTVYVFSKRVGKKGVRLPHRSRGFSRSTLERRIARLRPARTLALPALAEFVRTGDWAALAGLHQDQLAGAALQLEAEFGRVIRQREALAGLTTTSASPTGSLL